MRNGLLAVRAARLPEITDIGTGGDWKFETRALAGDFRKFEMQALDTGRSSLTIFDVIGEDFDGGGVTAKMVAAVLRNAKGRPLDVEINSPGGNYFEGVAIYNLLRRHDAEVNIQIVGIAASAASVIAMAGDTIAIAHNAEIMIHEARGVFYGTKSEMAESIDILAHIDNAMTETYAARSGRDKADFDAMIAGKDVYFRGKEAIDAGLADELMDREAQMPVYAQADFPHDKSSLDAFLAKQNMPRSERRELYRTIGASTRSTSATPCAGADEDWFAGLTALIS